MSNPEQSGDWPDRSWQPMPPTSPYQQPVAAPNPVYPPVSGDAPATYPTTAYPTTAYGAPYAAGYGYGYGAPAVQPTNGMAIGSMVVSIISFAGLCAYGFGGLLGIVGAILGHVARRQIKERGGSGDGMALAGIIVGWIATAIGLIVIALVVFFVWMAINAEPTGNTELFVTP